MLLHLVGQYVVDKVDDEALRLSHAPVGVYIAPMLFAMIYVVNVPYGMANWLLAIMLALSATGLAMSWCEVIIGLSHRYVEVRFPFLLGKRVRAAYSYATARCPEGAAFRRVSKPIVVVRVFTLAGEEIVLPIKIPPRKADVERFVERFNQLAGCGRRSAGALSAEAAQTPQRGEG